jgi:hypothetical protein
MRMKIIKALRAIARYADTLLGVRLPMDIVSGLRTR